MIVDGQANDLQLNLLTIADRLQAGGWNTSAYGKWDAGVSALCTVLVHSASAQHWRASRAVTEQCQPMRVV